MAMERAGGPASSAVAEMMFQRAPVAVYTCVCRTHVMLGGRRVSLARWGHQSIFSPCALQRYPSGLDLPLLPHLRVGCVPAPAPCDPQLRTHALTSAVADRGQKIFETILSLAREIRTPRRYVGYSFLFCWGLPDNANHACGMDQIESTC